MTDLSIFSKPIGILLKKPENTFSNGCIQQVLFLKKIFSNAGFNVLLLSVEPDYTSFELTGDDIIFTNDTYNFSKFHCIVLGSLVLKGESNQPYIRNLVSYNVPIINLICGNLFILHQEEFVFNTHNIISNYIQPYISENWVMEMYDYAIDYVKLLSSKPSKIVPYTWDIDIIKTYIDTNNILKNAERNHSKINLLLFEPNMSVHKNALIPLLICDEYNKKFPNKLNKVYTFCSDTVIKNMDLTFLNNLSIYSENKLETYGRIIMPYIVNLIEKNNEYLNVVVSYNVLNRLNFLHLEMFYMGIPIVHNCSPFEKNGYYFNDYQLTKAVDLIEDARLNFNKSRYIETCEKEIIQKFSPQNEKRVNDYRELLISIGNSKSDNYIEKTQEPIPSQSTSSYSNFKQGEGYVTILNDSQHYIIQIINSLLSEIHQFNLEIFTTSTSTNDIHELENFIANLHNPNISIKFINTENNINDSIINIISKSSFKIVNYVNDHSLSDIEIFTY